MNEGSQWLLERVNDRLSAATTKLTEAQAELETAKRGLVRVLEDPLEDPDIQDPATPPTRPATGTGGSEGSNDPSEAPTRPERPESPPGAVIPVPVPPTARGRVIDLNARNLGIFDYPGQPRVFARRFVTTYGGVSQHVVVLHNGNPKGSGVAIINGAELVRGRRKVAATDEPIVIAPGGMRALLLYERGSMADFWRNAAKEKFGREQPVTPGPAFDEKLFDAFQAERARRPDVGDYVMGWPNDKRGDGPDGSGIEPYWHLWRNSVGGWGLGMLEAVGTAQRNPRVMTNDDGELTYDPRVAHTLIGFIMPKGYETRIPTNAPDEAEQIVDWWAHDGEHFHRAYRAALWLFETFGDPFCGWYLEVLANFLEAVDLGTAGDSDDPNGSGYWSIARRINDVTPGKRSRWCGRAAIHKWRLATALKRLGIRSQAMGLVADGYVELFLKAADENGAAFYETRSGVNAKGIPDSWGADDHIVQTRELQLAAALFSESEDSRVVSLGVRLVDWLGPFPRSVINYENGEGAGGTNPNYELMTHGDLSKFDGSSEKLLDVALSRTVEAGGVQPLNSCYTSDLWFD